jgi:hypothetical protein
MEHAVPFEWARQNTNSSLCEKHMNAISGIVGSAANANEMTRHSEFWAVTQPMNVVTELEVRGEAFPFWTQFE